MAVPPVACSGEPLPDLVAGGHVDRGGAVVAGEGVLGREPANAAGLGEDPPGDHRTRRGAGAARHSAHLGVMREGRARLGCLVWVLEMPGVAGCAAGQQGATGCIRPGSSPRPATFRASCASRAVAKLLGIPPILGAWRPSASPSLRGEIWAIAVVPARPRSLQSAHAGDGRPGAARRWEGRR